MTASRPRAIVTGAAGFIGRHIMRHFASHYDVVGIDSFKYSTKSLTSGLNVIDHDIAEMDGLSLSELFFGADVLFHFAAEKLHNAMDDYRSISNTNIVATSNLFKSAVQAGIKKIIYASSLYAYGPYYKEMRSESLRARPDTMYGISKLAGELALEALHDKYSFDSASFRLFFIYGPGQYSGLGYPSVIFSNFRRIMNGLPPIIRGSGCQSLDYVYINDALRAMSMYLDSTIEGRYVANVCTGSAVTLKRLTELMLEVSGSELSPEYAPSDWSDHTMRAGYPDHISTTLGWKPAIDIRLGLEMVYSDLHNS